MMPPAPVNYDAIAHLYDVQPYRAKSPDPELSAFITQRAEADILFVLDIGCATGNQFVADRTVVRDACASA